MLRTMLVATIALGLLACDSAPKPAPAPPPPTPVPAPTPIDAAPAPPPSTPDAAPPTPVPDAMDPEDAASAAALRETLGPLRHGMTAAELVAAAGEPKKKGRPRGAGEATGDVEQDWSYPGGTVTLAAEGRDAPTWTVRAIASAPGEAGWKTQRGIGIGASRADVERAYADLASAAYSDEEHVVAGSIYGGIVFAIKRGKVSAIFVGASAD